MKEIGIAFAVAKAGAVQDVSYSAAAEKRIAASADAEAAAFARTNIHLRFSSEGGFIFDALGMQPLEFKEPMKMAESIVGAYERNRWKKEWLLVDTVYTAKSATIIVSQGTSADIVLGIKAGDAVAGMLNLANPKLGLSECSSSGQTIQVLGQQNLTPLYSCVRLRPSVLGRVSVEKLRGVTRVDNALAPVGLTDLLNL